MIIDITTVHDNPQEHVQALSKSHPTTIPTILKTEQTTIFQNQDETSPLKRYA